MFHSVEAIKVDVKLQSRRRKVVFGPTICMGRGHSRFRTYIFKSHSLPSMWPGLKVFV